ncbi:hypothetical protein O6H91_19G068300 [Diphasiastrum complanatum]|uniref:Uncharacterized protein n=1 Tax=Diphasiastrum complanatum TaxID=34168 RepID=A0ACC2AWD0_DIPCM|nr:hypothetical protein O6H91_19G068300 [Diphasiastrum complanatum]
MAEELIPPQKPASSSSSSYTSTSVEKKGLSMEGGTGDGSYARNSVTQAAAIGEVIHKFRAALRSLEFRDESVIRIADLGCSTGPNTLSVVSLVVNCLQENHPLDQVEYQVFFSDLPSNDFNTLFHMLPPLLDTATDQGSTATRAYHAAGVPGSFFRRQFPKESLHVAMSFLSLHWLSKVPEAVEDPNSPAWNKEIVSVDHAPLPVVEAFIEQAKEDLQAFLKSRAEEMVPGGLIFLLFLGREDHDHPEIQWPSKESDPSDPSDPHYLFTTEFLNSWNDLVSEGLIAAETRDAFNLPTFNRSLNEVEQAVNESPYFEIRILEQKVGLWFSSADREKWACDHKAFGKMWNNIARSTLGNLIESRLGPQLTHIFFQRNEANIIKLATEILSPRHYYVLNVVGLLRR